jgi:hypothetical protein
VVITERFTSPVNAAYATNTPTATCSRGKTKNRKGAFPAAASTYQKTRNPFHITAKIVSETWRRERHLRVMVSTVAGAASR